VAGVPGGAVMVVPESRKALLWAAAEKGVAAPGALWWPALAPLTPEERAAVRRIVAKALEAPAGA
jgi:hypothetical protein